jgi:hypothetical protein
VRRRAQPSKQLRLGDERRLRSAREPRWVRLDEELKRRLPKFGDLRLERAPVHGRQVGVVGLVRLRAEEVVRLVGRDATL